MIPELTGNIATDLIIGGMFFVLTLTAFMRYVQLANKKREQQLMEFMERQSDKFLEHLYKKNGHTERIAKDFNTTIKDAAKQINTSTDHATEKLITLAETVKHIEEHNQNDRMQLVSMLRTMAKQQELVYEKLRDL